VAILQQSSLLLLSNVVNHIFDRLLYCGLVGQILMGVAWGTPGANWLGASVETAISQFGYMGLILLVYEGTLTDENNDLLIPCFQKSSC
jgi:Kef-type K+ transport system membrane component KefB